MGDGAGRRGKERAAGRVCLGSLAHRLTELLHESLPSLLQVLQTCSLSLQEHNAHNSLLLTPLGASPFLVPSFLSALL